MSRWRGGERTRAAARWTLNIATRRFGSWAISMTIASVSFSQPLRGRAARRRRRARAARGDASSSVTFFRSSLTAA